MAPRPAEGKPRADSRRWTPSSSADSCRAGRNEAKPCTSASRDHKPAAAPGVGQHQSTCLLSAQARAACGRRDTPGQKNPGKLLLLEVCRLVTAQKHGAQEAGFGRSAEGSRGQAAANSPVTHRLRPGGWGRQVLGAVVPRTKGAWSQASWHTPGPFFVGF